MLLVYADCDHSFRALHCIIIILSFLLCSPGSVVVDYNVVVEEEEGATENTFSKDKVEKQVMEAVAEAVKDEYLGSQPVVADSVEVKTITFGV